MHLKLPDGSIYGYTGTVEFSQVIVDQSTGTVTIRARFPNPQSILLPGMFVTAQFAQAVQNAAILVPQQAVSRDPQGNATLYVVGPGNRAVQRSVVADRTFGADWVITEGLAPGEKVIIQGLGNLKDGAQIKPVPANTPQKVQAPAPGAMRAGSGRSRRG
jgi:membrane fusion protein (multidrug efflux system)